MELPSYKKIAINDLVPYANNSRTHSEEQIKQIAASIAEFGFLNPILVDEENNVLCGHGRIEGAKLAGLTEIPCINIKHLTETQKKAYIIADNKLAENAGWDGEILKSELFELKDAGFDLELIGFDESELEGIFAEDEETQSIKVFDDDRYWVNVSFKTEKEQEKFFEEMTERGITCKIMN